MPVEISPAVDQLIRDHIQSVEKLEILLYLVATPQQWWSASQVANALYRQGASVEFHLVALHTAGLLNQRQEVPPKEPRPLFCYSCESPQLDLAVRALEKAYRERKDTVIRLIFSRPPDALRSFADAFRIRGGS